MKRGSILSGILSGLTSAFENMLGVASTMYESCLPRLSVRGMNLLSIWLFVPLYMRDTNSSFGQSCENP